MRPEGLPDGAWRAGNASLPICVVYYSTESIAAGASKPKGPKALPADEIVKVPSIAQLQMFMAERQSAATSWSDISKVRSELRGLAAARSPQSYCQVCDKYMAFRTWRDNHPRAWEHTESGHENEKVKCKDCGKVYRKLTVSDHNMTKRHQYSLPTAKRDPGRWVYYVLCDFTSWYRKNAQDNHEGSNPHTMQVEKLALELPEEVAKRMAWCKFCKKNFQFHSMGEHLKTYVHQQAVWAYAAKEQADDLDEQETDEQAPAVASSSKKAPAPRSKPVPATAP